MDENQGASVTEAIEAKPASDGTVLIDRAEMDLIAFAGREVQDSRLVGLHVTPTRTEATNGRIAATLEHSKIQSAEFPAGPSEVTGAIPPAGVRIAVDDVKRLKAGTDKGKGYRSIPVLACAKVGATEAAATDLSSVTRVRVEDGAGFLPIDNVIPGESDGVRLCLNAIYLKALAEYAIKNGASRVVPSVKFWVRADKDGSVKDGLRIEIDLPEGRRMVGVLMPVRWD